MAVPLTERRRPLPPRGERKKEKSPSPPVVLPVPLPVLILPSSLPPERINGNSTAASAGRRLGPIISSTSNTRSAIEVTVELRLFLVTASCSVNSTTAMVPSPQRIS